MTVVDVRRSIRIAREPSVVRQQFADVAHHEATGVHRGVRFEVVDDTPSRCRYHQVTRVGPVRLRQELVLARTEDGPLVNTVLAGQFAGGSITFDIEPDDGSPSRSHVEARLVAELSGVQALLAPILRRSVARALSKALEEDKHDLEFGDYERIDVP